MFEWIFGKKKQAAFDAKSNRSDRDMIYGAAVYYVNEIFRSSETKPNIDCFRNESYSILFGAWMVRVMVGSLHVTFAFPDGVDGCMQFSNIIEMGVGIKAWIGSDDVKNEIARLEGSRCPCCNQLAKQTKSIERK